MWSYRICLLTKLAWWFGSLCLCVCECVARLPVHLIADMMRHGLLVRFKVFVLFKHVLEIRIERNPCWMIHSFPVSGMCCYFWSAKTKWNEECLRLHRLEFIIPMKPLHLALSFSHFSFRFVCFVYLYCGWVRCNGVMSI